MENLTIYILFSCILCFSCNKVDVENICNADEPLRELK